LATVCAQRATKLIEADGNKSRPAGGPDAIVVSVNILEDLDARGLIHDTTDRDALATLLATPTTLYHGIDPTADSLHIGNFVGVLALRRFQDCGHRPLVLVGGSTGMVGDPSGRSDERNLLDMDTLQHNVASIRNQLENLLDFGDGGAKLVNNYDWTHQVGVLDFLRDIGKHVTVNQMMAKESVKARMEGEHGISYTEFSYMLLQAYDFSWQYDHYGCELQIGGSDQWGNITAGIDLIRRRGGGPAHGLTWPLITKADGSKFGKSQDGNVWLSADRTSPYRFYQYWMNTDDRDLTRFLLQLTLLPVEEALAVVASHEADRGGRHGQRRLAYELTALVHGASHAAAASEASAALFGGEVTSGAAYEALAVDMPTTTVKTNDLSGDGSLVDILLSTGLSSSKGDARRALAEGSVYVHGERRSEDHVSPDDLRFGRYLLLRRGKRNYTLVISE